MNGPGIAQRASVASTLSKVEFQEWNEHMAQQFNPDCCHGSEHPLIRWIEKERVRTLLRLLSVEPSHRVLEVGVGAGNILKKIVARERVGLDLSTFLLEKARKRLGEKVKLLRGDAEELTKYVPPHSFDRVYCSEVLEHVQNPECVLGEIAKALHPDGSAVISVPNDAFIHGIKRCLKMLGVYRLLFPQLADRMEHPWHVHVFSRRLLRRMCEYSFTVSRIVAVPSVLLPLHFVVRLHPRPLLSDLPHILRCPRCHSSLLQGPTGWRCTKQECGQWYADRDGVPCLLVEEGGSERKAEEAQGENRCKNFFKRWPRLYAVLFCVVGPMFLTGLTATRFVRRFGGDTRILHAGSGTRRLSPTCLNVDLIPFEGVDVVADLAALPFADGSFDAVTCEQVLEHIPQPHRAAGELRRVVKLGGLIHVATPFLFPWHPSPSDYTRWTLEGLRELFPDCTIVEKGILAGPFSAFVAFFAALLATVLSCGSRDLQRFLQYPLFLLLAPLKLLDLVFAHLPGAELCAAGVYIVVRTPT